MTCQRCGNDVISVSAKTDDRFCMNGDGVTSYHGYVPYDLGIGGGDYMTFKFCPQCGQIQGDWEVV